MQKRTLAPRYSEHWWHGESSDTESDPLDSDDDDDDDDSEDSVQDQDAAEKTSDRSVEEDRVNTSVRKPRQYKKRKQTSKCLGVCMLCIHIHA